VRHANPTSGTRGGYDGVTGRWAPHLDGCIRWLRHRDVILGLGLPVAYFLKWISPSGLKDLLTGVWTPILGIFGAVTGFYYGTHASDRERG
jgi:hypothetical protein